MKMIINIDEEVLKKLNVLAENDNTSVEGVINEILEHNIVTMNGINPDEFKQFAITIQKYFHEDLESMYDVINSNEAIETDKPMLEVYKKLYQDIARQNGVALQLFEAYKKANHKSD